MEAIPLPDAGTLHAVAGLAPVAQVAAVLVIGAVLGLLVWTRRPPSGPGRETFDLVIASMTEQAKATNALAEQVERIVEQNSAIIGRLSGAG